MKNIHVLSTDKPSRLYKHKFSETFRLLKNELQVSGQTISQNIYITNDEEIKEGWEGHAYKEDVEGKVFKHFYTTNEWYKDAKKIILTTDQDLIKDGVQEIDDEFLEWFVQNPSCEEVEILRYKSNNMHKMNFGYKIIIPKEEPVFSQLEVGKDFEQEEFELGEEEVECNMCGNIMSLLEDESIYVCFNSECTRCYEEYKEEHKQETLEEAQNQQFKYDNLHDAKEISSRIKVVETLEEAAERYAVNRSSADVFRKAHREDFINGAKWQQERSYSEEEVLEILDHHTSYLESFIYQYIDKNDMEVNEKWFEQFKKK